MTKKWIFLAVFATLLTGSAFAQTNLQDTLIQIEDIEVRSSRLKNFALGSTIERINPLVLQRNNSMSLTDIFSSYTGISINSYGLGGLSTMSIRGGGASHTAVLWNGFNIQSPMSGGANLSTIPAFLVNDISIQHGGSGSLFGSGAVGGVVHISSFGKLNQQNNISFQAGMGSFNKKNLVFSAKTGDETYAFSLKIFTQSATNEFEFTNTEKPNNPSEKQTNAGMRQYGFMPDLQIKTSGKSTLNISALYQKFSKDLQTLMTDIEPNQDNQADDNLYLSANWQYISSKYTLNVRSGIINNKITLTDKSLPNPDEEPIATNKASSIINEIESKIFIADNHILNVGINYTNEKGESSSYTQNESRNRISLFSSYKIIDLFKGLNTVISLRNELEKGKTHPFTYSLGSDYLLSENIILKGNVSRNYRIPSFNDLYWKSDIYSQGNPQLKPESGYSGEFGISEKLKAGAINFDFSQTAFGASIKDWIVWVPNDAGIWTPDNKEKGKSYGLEIKGNSFVQKKDSKFELTGFYTWTKAQLTGQIQTNENQMIYIPEHRFMAFLSYTYKQLSASFNINHIGERYYNQENTLPGYQLGNITFDYNLPIKDNTLTATFKVNNLWNTKYNVIANYAMPLRNYQIALKLNINTNY